ncbi:class I SAM-dependent methyltransferase [Clostridiaceae bacterium M8S5]|nr:class I SAM-dependent methyltransferase [Clostridiaceae bacterium M8S5]
MNSAIRELCRKVADMGYPVMDIATGPSLGLLPEIIALNPDNEYLATDACPLISIFLNKFIKENHINTNLSFASFNALNMPIKSSTIDVITSNIGLSSLRTDIQNGMGGIKEVARILRCGGYMFTIENRFTEPEAVKEAFRIWGKQCWFNFDIKPWQERFELANLRVINSEVTSKFKLNKDDNNLAKIANENNIDLIVEHTAYQLVKR